MPFSDFIRLCKQHMISKENGSGVDDANSSASLCSIPQDPTPGQIYLAQVLIIFSYFCLVVVYGYVCSSLPF